MWVVVVLLIIAFSVGMVALAVGLVRVALKLAQLANSTDGPQTAFFSSSNFETQSTFNLFSPMTIAFTTVQKTAVLVAGLAFHLLFWGQIQGLNLLIWYVGCAAFMLWDTPTARESWAVWAVAVGGLLAVCGVVLYGSGVAKLAVWTSLALLVGLVNQPTLRLVHHALLTGLSNVFLAVGAWIRSWRGPQITRTGPMRLVWYYGRLLGLPLVAMLIFHLLFAMANPQYAALASSIAGWVGAWLNRLFIDLSFVRLTFFLFGLALAAGLLLRVPVTFWIAREAGKGEFVQRLRRAKLPALPAGYQRGEVSPVGLRKEYLAALAALVLVNGLLLVENVLDVQNIWLHFNPALDFDLAQFVHEGTWALVVSILLAMALVLYFFRGNLNFYSRAAHRLRPLTTVWIIQNAVLAASVGLRNYHYISRMGLAYKRIGVCFFLMLVAFGLLTVALKIWQRRSAFSLVRLNSWAVYAVLLLLALGNWELWIARYNLQPRFLTSLDRDFLLSMPPRVLPELVAHAAAFTEAYQQDRLASDRDQFLQHYPNRSGLSWNWADERAYQALMASRRPQTH